MTRCCSRITKVFKRAKADSVEASAENTDLPRCEGAVTFKVVVSQGCCCGMGSSSELEIQLTCSVCKYPTLPDGAHHHLLYSSGSIPLVERLLAQAFVS